MESYIKTILLLGGLTALLVFVGGLIGGREGIYFAFIISLLMNGGAYFFSERLALAASGAKPLSSAERPELYVMVGELAKKMGLPMPKLYIIPATQANAFATGRGPGHASVAVTEGILKTLSKEELKGVLAHELAHIKNRDILIASIAAVLASTISFLANMSFFAPRDEEGNNSGALGLVAALLVPIAASIIQMAVSRQREFGADETGARTIGDGDPLARALLAINNSTKRAPLAINPAYSSLYIDNPLGNLGRGLLRLFSTHPPVEERIRRLKNI